jgi:vacuolar protein sorting-associated protein 26
MFALTSLFSTPVTAECTLDAEPNRKQFVNKDGTKLHIFTDGEDVAGTVSVSIPPGKTLEHQGIKVELVGQLTTYSEGSYDFFTISKDLESSGTLLESKKFKFRFVGVDKPHETFHGTKNRLRYFVRVTVSRGYGGTVQQELEFVVQNITAAPVLGDSQSSIKLEVGIEEFLHIEFEYDRNIYHTKDVVIGKVFFVLCKLKIKHMQLDILRKEIIGAAGSAPIGNAGESETIAKFELMDGTPVKNECIPVRLYLSAYDTISPTYKAILNKLSVKYYLNLVLVDEDDRRYFKQQEINIWRKKIG